MITFRTGSLLHRFITLLSSVGEFPTQSLRLLGNEREMKELTAKLTGPQTVRNSQTGESISLTKAVSVSGKGKSKTVRLYKSAIPILKWIGAEKYYLSTFRSHKVSGGMAHIERNHRVAESVAMFAGAGFEFREYRLPQLRKTEIRQVELPYPSFYSARYLKQVESSESKENNITKEKKELNKTMFSRAVGAVFAGKACYPVYNTRGAVMKWCGKGESKAQLDILGIARMNFGIDSLDSAILVGASDEGAMATIEETARNIKLDLRFDAIYGYIHFIPLSEVGMRQLALFTVPDLKERLLDLLFEPEQRSYDNGIFEYDALIDGVYVLSYLDGDIARLMRFKSAQEKLRRRCEVLCFPDQVSFLQKYLEELAEIRVVDRDLIESELNLKRRYLFEED